MKVLSTLIIVAALGATVPATVQAQQTEGRHGRTVDGMGGGGNKANQDAPDGPGLTFDTMSQPKNYFVEQQQNYTYWCRVHALEPAWCLAHGYATN